MMIRIKVCGMIYPENIREVALLGPDYIGLIFYPRSLRCVSGKTDPALLDMLPGNIKKAGVFVNSQFEEITRLVRLYSLDIVQLHGNESPEICNQLKMTGVRVIKSFGIGNDFNFERCREFIPSTDFFLFDTSTPHYGGSGVSFDWSLLENYRWEHPFFLSGGIGPGDSERILRISNPGFYGIDLNSGFEDSPGIKDINKLGIFISEIRNRMNGYE